MTTFEVRTERILIDAPVGLVWDVLTDVEQYGEWNPFTPQARTDFKIGSPADLLVRMGPAKVKITETVCAFEEPRLIAWSKSFGARWFSCSARAASGTRERDELPLPQHRPIDGRACADGTAVFRRLYAPRFH